MGSVSLEDYFGGAIEATTASDLSLWYDRGRRLQAITALGAGLVVTLPPADSRAFLEHEGRLALVVHNPPGSFLYVIQDVEGDISGGLPVNAWAFLHRYRRAVDGAWRFALDPRLSL